MVVETGHTNEARKGVVFLVLFVLFFWSGQEFQVYYIDVDAVCCVSVENFFKIIVKLTASTES